MNVSKSERAFSSLIKAKLKTFLLNQNTFYFNSKVNSDKKILSLLPTIVTSAFYKLDLYLNKIFSSKTFQKKMNNVVSLIINVIINRKLFIWQRKLYFVCWIQQG